MFDDTRFPSPSRQVHAVEPVVNFREVLRSKFSSCNEVVVHDGSAKDLTRNADLTATSLEIMVSKGNHPQMALIQVSELL